LTDKGWRERTVLEMQPVVVEPTVYRLQRKYCARCRQGVQARAPGVLPKSLLGNQLIAEVLTSHYVHGEPLGRVSERLGLACGSLFEMAHRTAHLFRGVVALLSAEYRHTSVRHADETGWRTDRWAVGLRLALLHGKNEHLSVSPFARERRWRKKS
jgi:hypothetical protein